MCAGEIRNDSGEKYFCVTLIQMKNMSEWLCYEDMMLQKKNNAMEMCHISLQ